MRLQDVDGYTEITSNSIDKVICKQIVSGEGSQRYNKRIQDACKYVLNISLNRKDGHKHDEVGFVINLREYLEVGPILGCWDNNLKTSIIPIQYNYEYWCMMDESASQSCVFIHNHPNNSKLSISDIMSLLSTTALKAVVAVGNNGCIHYAIKTNDSNNKYLALSIKINKLIADKSNISKVYNKLINEPGLFDLYIE